MSRGVVGSASLPIDLLSSSELHMILSILFSHFGFVDRILTTL